jgi:hypothetical protein
MPKWFCFDFKSEDSYKNADANKAIEAEADNTDKADKANEAKG